MTPPAKFPGMHDKNSKPEILFFNAKLLNSFFKVAAPQIKYFLSSVKFIPLNPFPNLIIFPEYPLSLKRIFDPFPKIKIFYYF